MASEQIKDKILSFGKWDIWLYRKYGFLVTYLISLGATRKEFAKEGIDGEFPASVYDSFYWYTNREAFKLAGEIAGRYLKQKDIFTLTSQCEQKHQSAKKQIINLFGDETADPLILFKQIIELIMPMNVYVWVAHAAEEYYWPLLKEAVKNHVKPEEVDKFIGDVSFPIKKNAHVLLEEDVRAGVSVSELHKKYGWMKSRTSAGFAPGYTLEEMKTLKKEILSKKPEERFAVSVPDDLKQLVSEVQELVYLRTYRSDALFDLYFLAQPIFDRVAKCVGVKRIDFCSPLEVMTGHATEFADATAVLQYYDDVVICDSIFNPQQEAKREFSGSVAWRGCVAGKVKIVRRVEEIGKVEEGDILVTNMTIPVYISAMKKASAFVTDEGGITCHVAIIAREMKKPCIIGTKIATQIFKDGDMVEVDAERGIVRRVEAV